MKIYENCKKCANFIQHYGILGELNIFKIENCGHCCRFRKLKENCADFSLSTKNFGENVYRIALIYEKVSNKIEKLCNEIHSAYYNTFLKNVSEKNSLKK